MYKVYVDDICIHDSKASAGALIRLVDPELKMTDNAAGSFTFKILPENVGYNKLKKLTSIVRVEEQGDVIWSGRIISESEDFYKQRSVTCEGALAFLNDSIQPPAEYHDISPRALLKTFLDIHNSQVDSKKQFQVGAVTVKDPNDSLYRYTNYESTWACIEDKLLERLGGHMYIRRENGIMYIDWITDYLSTNTQIIDFGKNLMDFTKNFDMTDLVTVLVPRGERLDESPIEALDAYLTVASVNNGSIFVENADAVSRFGKITKVVDWDDVTEPANLLRKAQEYLEDQQFDKLELEVSAIDLHYLNPSIENIKILDKIRCRSLPHGMDRYFPVTEVTIQLNNPESTTYILGDSINGSLTDVNNALTGQITNQIKANTAFENKRAENITLDTDKKIEESNNRTDDLIEGVTNQTNTALEAVNKRVDSTNSDIQSASEALNKRMDEEAEKAKKQTDEALQEAKDNASEILKLATNGYITIVTGKNGSEALIISETQDVTKSQKFWKWNVNGLGYTKDGGETYGLAITMDGAIVADYITAGKLNAGIIKTGILSDKNGNTSFNLSTGYLKMNKGAINIGDGTFMVDENGNVAMTKGSININDGAFFVTSQGNVSMTRGSITINNGKFSVSKEGYLISTYGKIGGFTIGEISIKNEFVELTSNGIYIQAPNSKKTIGLIGVNHDADDNTKEGLMFNLNKVGAYVGFAARDDDTTNYFYRMIYVNQSFGAMQKGTIAVGCDVDFRNFTLKNAWLDINSGGIKGGINGTLSFYADYTKDSNGNASTWGQVELTFKDGVLTAGAWH